MKNLTKYFCKLKKSCTFAASIPQTFFLTFVGVAIFFAANIGYQIPLGCCTSMSVIVCGRTGGDSLSYFDNFRPMIPQTAKNRSSAKYSNANLTPNSAKTVPITFTLTGVRNNPYLYSIRKAFFEFIEEEMCGHIFSESRFVKKYEAANTLFREFRRALRGKTIIIK